MQANNGDQLKKDDFSELPPNQRRKKLQSKIEEITGKICQETAARDGLMKMKQVYESNPALGDPMSIQGQLTENGHRLDKLRSELKKFQDFLDELEGKAPSSPAIRTKDEGDSKLASSGSIKKNRSSRTKQRRSSVSDGAESLSRSGSDSSVSQQRRGSKNSSGETAAIHGSSRSPESGICTSSMSLPSSSSGSNDNGGKSRDVEEDEDEDEEFYDADPLPIVGKCRALYSFEVTSEGSIRMEENEELWLIESDQGDGWTRVRRIKPSPVDPMPEGFVPTSYIETTELFAVPHPV